LVSAENLIVLIANGINAVTDGLNALGGSPGGELQVHVIRASTIKVISRMNIVYVPDHGNPKRPLFELQPLSRSDT